MGFTITITESTVKQTVTPRVWCQTSVKEDGRAIFDYTPQVDEFKAIETKRLEQTVETLDLAAVIKAINGL